MIRWFTDIFKGVKTVFTGMRITAQQYFNTNLHKQFVTLQYPDERWQVPRAFRGMIKCDTDVCIVCYMCSRACPVSCISIEGIKEEGKSTKTATKFVVDYGKCLYCGLCVEPCPVDCIFHSHDYETAAYTRDTTWVNWANPDYKVENPFVGDNPHGSGKKPKKKAPAKKAAPKADDGAATAVADAPAGEMTISRVWIEEGCIVCDLCEDTCPEVFDVQEETCIIRTDADLTKVAAIIEAAEGCPVDVIKYE
jgi:NADH-quinone oxidoreductase subunit I